MPPPPGGIGLQAELFLRYLEGVKCPVGSIRTNYEWNGVWRPLGQIRFLRGIIRALVFYARALRQIPGTNILHVFSGSGGNYFLYTVPSLLFGRMHGKKVILHYHGGGARDFFNRYGLIAKRFLKYADRILVPSRFLEKLFADFGVRTTVLPNILEMDRFPYRERVCFRPRFIVTRHLEPVYDVGCAIRAFSMVVKKYPEAHLMVLGEGSERVLLEDLAKELGVAESLTFAGNIPNEDVYGIYDESDIFLNSSRVDNFPVSILEAFASGLPVISSDAGGIPYIVRDGETGVLFPAGNPVAMAGKMLSILGDQDMARRFSKQGLQEVKKYSWENVKGDLFRVYGYAGP
ncbi:MAG: glycosyltransferase family 1 protein [Syntrophobacterales bacterium]|nr:MAG: glycosyltransferase family 1 protein [Syntrophobacterales bacterium]